MQRVIINSVLVLCVLGIGLIPVNAFAAGTPAGTVISNTATLSYQDLAGNSFPVLNATVNITVDQVAGVAITPATASQTSGDSSAVDYPFVVANTGNGTDVFDLAVVSTQNWTPAVYVDIDRNGVLDAGELLAGPVIVSDSVLADSAAYFIARIFVPSGVLNTTVDSLTATATSQFTASVSSSGVYVTTISIATLALTKNQSLGNPQPGRTITYTIDYDNNGTGTAQSTVLADTLGPNVTLVGGTISGGGIYDGPSRSISWNLGNVSGGQSGSVSFQVTVNANVPAGTNLSNRASVSFIESSNGLSRSSSSNQTTATVTQLPSLSVDISPASQTQDVGLPAQYLLTLTNTGNAPDSASLASSSSLALTWLFYVDVNNDSLLNGGDYLANLSNLGTLAQGSSMNIIAVDTLPTSTPDGSVDTTQYSFTSLSNGSTNSSVSGATTVRAPVMAVSKAVVVVGGGPSIPGATLRYTISFQNNGTGASSSVVISDAVPNFTNYVLNSVRVNGVAKTDDPDADEVTVASGTITVDLGALASSGSGTIDFDVVIQ